MARDYSLNNSSKTCFICSTEFMGKSNSMYCGNECREIAYKAKVERQYNRQRLITKERSERETSCVICDERFVTKHNMKKTCSDECKAVYKKVMDARSYRNNKSRVYAANAKYRATKRQAVPSWFDKDEVEYIYSIAKDKDLVVDHIVPLNHECVCGLHVQDNLRCIPQNLNAIKQNRYWPDMPEELSHGT